MLTRPRPRPRQRQAETRLEYFSGYTNISQVFPDSVYPINGYLWAPKNAQHPILAQIFIKLAAQPGRPVPQQLADRSRALERDK